MNDMLKKSGGDYAHKAGEALISSLPIVGSAAATLFNEVIIPPLEKRRNQFLQDLWDALKKLEETVEGFKIENLAENDMFITAVMHASRSAIQNHQKEKREALRNAVLNSASKLAPEEDLQLMFLNWIDEFTPWHIRVLNYFENPIGWFNKNKISPKNYTSGSPAHGLTQAFPELNDKRNFYDPIITDLYSKGLIKIDSLHLGMDERGIYAPRTSMYGTIFIRFVSSPLED